MIESGTLSQEETDTLKTIKAQINATGINPDVVNPVTDVKTGDITAPYIVNIDAYVESMAALNAIAGFAPAAIRGGADAAAQGGDAWDIISGSLIDGTLAAISFGGIAGAAENAMGSLLAKAPGLIRAAAPAITAVTGATVAAVANTGFNIITDAMRGRDIDWEQQAASLGIDFLFGLFTRGKNGNTYTDPQTGKPIDIPDGKMLADVNPEAASFYKGLGDTKVTGGLDNAMGDIYMNYMDIPESVVSRSGFEDFRTAYYIYDGNPTIANAAAFLKEASEIYDMPGVTKYTFDPQRKINAAMEADFNAKVSGMLDEAYAAGEVGMPAGEFAQDKGVPGTLTDADAVGLTMKMDGDGNGGYNGGDGNAEGASKIIKTLPQYAPDPNAVPMGQKTKISPNCDSETTRSLTRENESADILAKKGYAIKQNPKVDGSKKPDYKIGEEVFDNYSPSSNKSPRGIASEVKSKIEKGQTERVVLNLSDWKGNINDLVKQIKDWPIKGLKELIAIDKNGNVYHLFP